MKRVVVTRRSLLVIQVCAIKDATDEEIIEAAEADSPCGTSAGWGPVVRDSKEHPNMNPIQCADDPDRIHFLVEC